ncbi:hypothetical protein BJ878DRAFT_338010 [Calycina marina]|uniref:Uncharacterized protein n=1 Tax=Calycina marina TaxID=1763456 RepID=A0A9P8CG05_9HELO|nr:hypothetical protein BJ878DRAFT_338010 [Calycina marina]
MTGHNTFHGPDQGRPPLGLGPPQHVHFPIYAQQGPLQYCIPQPPSHTAAYIAGYGAPHQVQYSSLGAQALPDSGYPGTNLNGWVWLSAWEPLSVTAGTLPCACVLGSDVALTAADDAEFEQLLEFVVPSIVCSPSLFPPPFGCNSPEAGKNVLNELVEAGYVNWKKGITVKDDNEYRMMKQIGALGWTKMRMGMPGQQPVV